MGDFDNIKSRTFNYGDEKEAEWPPRFGNGICGVKYYDREKKCMVDGYPPQRETFGVAPTVIFDSMDEQYHHGACRPISSRKEWAEADKESNSVTQSPNEFKKNKERREAIKRAQEREIEKDKRNATVEAVRSFAENRTEFEGKLKKRAEEQIKSAKKAGLTKQIKEEICQKLKSK